MEIFRQSCNSYRQMNAKRTELGGKPQFLSKLHTLPFGGMFAGKERWENGQANFQGVHARTYPLPFSR